MFTQRVSELESKGYLNLEYVKNLYQTKKDTITDKTKSQQLEKLLKDIHYCIEMKSLENVPQEKRLDIVTITGLVFGRVHRLENEMRTVVEQWKHLENSPIRVSSPLLISSNHHHRRAISSSNDSTGSGSSSSKWSFSNSNFEQKQNTAPKFLQAQRKINHSSNGTLVVGNGGYYHNNNSNNNSRPTSPSNLKNYHINNEDSTFSSGDEK
ncbi:expressed protein [Dictyostelium purpureum]|uniref:Expressed protein n=1 Tax=Dictyostelium purpureum TaxID=5786 RepID=F1A1B6_DICPU|nr:uncharacterized protein DICPUDRAFT_93052 [Dictyostelium purpureum]EGC30016.1 expressed protein [Dictyostelium purpureum]|eukprot:XP_003293462.1 expressed protein [Dictyostelium purpureum]